MFVYKQAANTVLTYNKYFPLPRENSEPTHPQDLKSEEVVIFAKWPTRGHYKDTAKQQAFVLNQNRANFIFFLRFLWYWNKYPNEFSDPEIVERLNWLKVIQIFDSTWHGLFVSTTYAYQINSAHFHLRYRFLELAKFLQQQGFNLFQDIRDSGISGKLFFWLAT